MQQQILELLQSATGTAVTKVALSAVGGGSINDTYKIITNTGANYFCKINQAKKFPSLFTHEQQGLELLARQQVIRTPQVIGHSDDGNYQLLVLEWIAGQSLGIKQSNLDPPAERAKGLLQLKRSRPNYKSGVVDDVWENAKKKVVVGN